MRPDQSGPDPHKSHADPGTIGNMLLDGTQGPLNYRDLDAAIRAYFDNGDSLPLLRLIAENNDNEGCRAPPKELFLLACFRP